MRVATMTATRCVMDRAITHSMKPPMSHLHPGHRAFLELRLHGECAGENHDVARGEAAQHGDAPAVSRTHGHFPAVEPRAAFTIRMCDEDVRLTLKHLHGVFGDE